MSNVSDLEECFLSFNHTMNMTNNTDSFASMVNATCTELELVARWTVTPIISLMTLIIGCLGNGALLMLFLKDHTLRTPFNVYLVNLLIANLSCVLVQYPMDVVTNLYGFAWPLGYHACTVYLYACNVLEAAILNAHQLIALSRVWAVLHPITYRNLHSVRLACSLCGGMWIYVHSIVLPGIVLDALYYRLPLETNGCLLNMNAQVFWNRLTMLVIYDPPLVVMLVAFPVIIFAKTIRRRRTRRRLGAVVPSHSRGTGPSAEKNPTILPTNSSTPHGAPVVLRVRPNSRGNLVLGMLTISALTFWAPIDIYYNLAIFTDVVLSTWYYQVAVILFSCQNMVDPLLFTIALESIRKSIRRTLTSVL